MKEELWRCTVCGGINVFYDMGSNGFDSLKSDTLYSYCKNGCVVPEERIKGKSLFKRVYLEGERDSVGAGE